MAPRSSRKYVIPRFLPRSSAVSSANFWIILRQKAVLGGASNCSCLEWPWRWTFCEPARTKIHSRHQTVHVWSGRPWQLNQNDMVPWSCGLPGHWPRGHNFFKKVSGRKILPQKTSAVLPRSSARAVFHGCKKSSANVFRGSSAVFRDPQ